MKLIKYRKLPNRKRVLKKQYGVLYTKFNEKQRCEGFLLIEDAFDFAMAEPEWITCFDPAMLKIAIQLNHRILSKGGVREFIL
jgi:hypothetical protein